MPSRVPREQTVQMGTLGVTNAAQPLPGGLDITSLIQAFMISNPSTNVNSVFLGDASVTTTNGIEITPGSAPLFSIDDVRQLYEVQNALMSIYELVKCKAYPQPDFIPLVVWSPIHFSLITTVAGPVNVGVMYFKSVYV